ncbi:MAG: phosphodiester glycosidase family protein [Eubacteriales bacterium]|nr:phosphodiester glycosidase family protein [Eubacteriales bacterium]
MNRTLRTLSLLAALLLSFHFCGTALADDGTQADSAADITADCTFLMPEALADKTYRITDDAIESYQEFTGKHTLEIALPNDETAQGIYLEWYTLPDQYFLEEYNTAGELISSYENQPFVNTYYPIDDAVTALRLVFRSDAQLSTVRVYGEGALPQDVQLWQPVLEQADLLCIAATPQAAVTDFYGVFASYTAEHEISTALVVLAKENRTMQEGLLAGLWKMGIDDYPQFGCFAALNNDAYKRVRGSWGAGATAKFIQSVLTRYGAKIVLTHAPDDQSYDAASQYCAEVVKKAVDDGGAEAYPSLQKLYFAAPYGTTTLDWSASLIRFSGETALAVSNAAYAENSGMRVFHKTLEPTATFALGYSTVGEDTGVGSLLEHIDTAQLANYIDPTPSPTPSPEPTLTPTATPSAETSFWSEAETQPEQAADSSAERYMLYGAGAVVLLGIAISLAIAFGRGRYIAARYGRGRAAFSSLLPFAIAGILAAVFLLFVRPILLRSEPMPVTPEPTSEFTPEPSEPAEAAQESAEENPQAEAQTPEDSTISDEDQYFRQPGDPEEVIVSDNENGHWEYKTDTLSIIIDRTVVTEPKLNRVYTADIRMRGEDSFRTVQAAENRNGMGSIHPWALARASKCVLLITGDNLIQSDKQYKGILIRDGIVFQDRKAIGSMAMYPDMTMHLVAANSMDADELLMDGARNVFSFGPVLVSDGTVNAEAAQHRLSRRNNPRTGIGMIEPGHFIAIVVDGRQPDYSVGMLLDEFAQLFVDHGCKVAYNLDGGVSACMVFMGEQLNRHGNKRVGTYQDSYQRRVPDGLVWGYSDQVPDVDDPIYNTGTSKVPTP